MTQAPRAFDVEALWALDRIAAPSLSPDGAQAVAAVTRYDMDANTGRTSLWLFSTLGGAARRLTEAGDKDGSPQWSPRGDLIAFTAKREQGGVRDDETQLYVIAADGGEARRVGQVATGVEAFKWFPDGRRIAFVSWVWPDRKAAAQADALREFKARKETAYVTDEALYRFWDHHVPAGRVPHLHLMDVTTGQVRDLFEGSAWELERAEPDANCFDISPDGRRIAFAFDPAADKRLDNRFALAELDVRTRRVDTLLQDADWSFTAPRYSQAGGHLAFLASHQAVGHNQPDRLAVLDQRGHWAVFSDDWDHEVTAPLCWTEDDQTVLLAAEERGRRHLWRFALGDRRAERVFEGGHVGSFAHAGGLTVVNHDSLRFPPRLSVLDGATAQRIDKLNDERLAGHRFGHPTEVSITGARGDAVQMWLVHPPGFDAKKKWPVMHVIHGGPHSAFGDSWHWRWNHQVFAAQGYVVACVNYHGSSGFGHEFLDSITGHWGEYELQDIEAATDWLLRQRWVSARRIVATGGSYGGYMVAWMNGHVQPGRYQAYVCHAGCYDWQAMYADDAYAWHRKELGAAYWDDPARVAAQSPHAFAQHFSTPTLVIHGALDYRVPDAQGLAYYNTLKSLGVPARLVWFPDENHWVLKPRNSRLWYREFFDWLARHLPKAH
ncbi:alpha/beta hydrolase family protein [Roseateles cellulosilyticus]|uniref:Acyl-peptide hydrolase n=1 Tax=Pelomonas cellulosilytica TaxID=2906762 RepID=A0ABS8XVG8_9BURK|nr:S9 family peptidase [Pelomonas sp. P8]MCE4554713.1 S9 family peptidase [Pelomonas sp. P8]